MSLLTAKVVDTVIPHNTDKELRMQIFTEEGNEYDVSASTVYLALSISRTGSPPVVQKEAEVVNASEGRVLFRFTPEDTEHLPSIAYSGDVMLKDDTTGEKWPVWSGRIGITARVPLEEEG